MKKIKLIVAAILLLASISTFAQRQQIDTSNIYWEIIENGGDSTLVISGSGDMPNFASPSVVPWYSIRNTLKYLQIGDSITRIGQAAFYGCSGFTDSLVIPFRVKSIEKAAFYGCSGFTGTLTLSDSLTFIGEGAFRDCIGFTGSLTIPSGVTSIGQTAFYNCISFNGTLTLSDSLTTFGSFAFSGCGFTGSLVIPSKVKSIPSNAFYNCLGFNGTLTLPEGLISIGTNAFRRCNGFTGALVLPDSLTTLEQYAFANCSGLTSLTLPQGLTSIGIYTFSQCLGLTGHIAIPSGLASIANYAFQECRGITSVTFPEGLRSIGNNAFYYCTSLTDTVRLPEGLTSIGTSSFSECHSLRIVILPSSLTTIGNNSFLYCTRLSEIHNFNPTPVTLGKNTFYRVNTATCKLFVDKSSVSLYRNALYWQDFSNIIAFPNKDANLASLSLSEGVLMPDFHPDSLDYHVEVSYPVSEITITALLSDTNATMLGDTGVLFLQTGDNIFTIIVTAEDSITEKSYTVTVIRTPPSDDASLSNLTVSEGELHPAFDSEITSYNVSVPYEITSITISGTPSDTNASYTGSITDSTLTLGDGNIFNFTVTAEDTTITRTYTVTVTREFNTDATLAALTVSEGTLTPAFDPSVRDYSVVVPYATTTISIAAIQNDTNATLSGTVTNAPLIAGTNNVFNIIVTAQNGTTIQTYTVTVAREPNNDVLLSNLTVSEGALSPAFNPSIALYTVSVPYSITTISITGTPSDVNATLTGNVTDAPLSLGSDNIFNLLVTAQDGATTQIYTVTVTRELNTVATLSDLTVSEGILSPAFSAETTEYTVTVPYETSTISITGTPTDTNASVAGNEIHAPLAAGSDNTFSVTVTAQNGTTTKSYTVIVARGPNSDANLSDIALSAGTLSPAFNAETTNYTVSVPYETSTISITGTPTDSNASVAGNEIHAPLAAGSDNTFSITVTAQDGTTTKSYTVLVARGPNSDATLSTIALSAGTLSPAFSAETTNYTVTVPYETSAISITGTPTDSNASVAGNEIHAPLAAGSDNTFSITVTAQDGTTTKSYAVIVARGPNSDATLSDIALSAGTLSPAFNAETTNYTVTVPYETSTISITGTPTDSNASVAGNEIHAPLVAGSDNTFSITVTAQDGTTTKSYTVIVARGPNSDATLSAIALSAGTLSPAFSADTTEYTVSVPYETTTISIAGTSTDTNATVTGNAIHAPLTVGNSNIFTLIVTAQDGISSETYTITVIRELNTDATLSDIFVSAGELTPAFDPEITDYSITVPYANPSISITGTVNDPNATLTGNVVDELLQFGDGNIFTITVTAQNGSTIKNYTVTVTRSYNNNANLAGLILSAGTLTPAFDAEITDYAVTVPHSISTISITGIPSSSTATVTGNVTDAPLTVGSDNVFHVVVTAHDETTIKTYTITITRESGVGIETCDNVRFSVYPNPTQDQVYIQSEKVIRLIQIYDLSGKVLQSWSNIHSNETTIDLSNFANGSYLLRVDENTIKVIKN